MFIKYIKFVSIILLLYQSPLYSKSTSFENFNSKHLSKYFSGIVAFENKDNPAALDFFYSTKILINKHDPYLKRYISSLVLEKKISQAINVIKQNKDKKNSNFFEAYLLLIIDSLKKGDLNRANIDLSRAFNFAKQDRFNLAILESLEQYIFAFKEKKVLDTKKNFGKLSVITEAFQRCYLEDVKTDAYFTNLINDNNGDYTRYIYFYLSYLIENDRIDDAKSITNEIQYINTTLLLSQAKSWIENENSEKLVKNLEKKEAI